MSNWYVLNKIFYIKEATTKAATTNKEKGETKVVEDNWLSDDESVVGGAAVGGESVIGVTSTVEESK